MRDAERRRVRQRAYYAARPGYAAAKGKIFYARRRAWIDAFKDRPCMDCGCWFPIVAMDFDHRPEGKLFEIAAGWGRSKQALAVEIAKCDVVCSNCHRIRTAFRRPLPVGVDR